MPITGGRPGDPLWTAIGFLIGVIAGICLHQLWAGVGIGMALGVAFGLISEDRKRGYRRPADPLWFVIGVSVGLVAGVILHYLGLSWGLGLGLGLALVLFLGAVAGTARADHLRARKQENEDLVRPYRD